MNRIVNTDEKELDLKKTYPLCNDYALKPNGLWYSIDDEWIEWCKGNMKHRIYKFNIEIDIDKNKMCIIKNYQQLKDFRKAFEKKIINGSDIPRIDWNEVKKRYAGFEIRNYHQLKYDNNRYMFYSTWLYSLDISSGCIWDLSIIKKYEVVKNKQYEDKNPT